MTRRHGSNEYVDHMLGAVQTAPLSGDPISRHLTTTGVTGGSSDMNVDGSVTPVDFYITAPADTRLLIFRMVPSWRDAGGGNVGEFGNIGSALTNGLTVWCRDDQGQEQVDFTDGRPIKTNGEWAAFCYDVQRVDCGTGEDQFSARWTFAKDGYAVELPAGHEFGMTVSDDLTGLSAFTCRVAGVSCPDA